MATLDFSQTHIRASRPISSYSKVRAFVGWTRRNSISQLVPQVRAKQYLDVGCGSNLHPNFATLDWEWCPGLDLTWDVTTGIPFDECHMRGIFCEHTLEHLPVSATVGVLKDMHRVLRPNGVARIVVPSLEIYVQRYLDHTPMPYADQDQGRFVENVYTPAMSINRIMRFHGHQFIYDFETMRRLLDDAGFRDIEQASFRQGTEPLADRDSAHRAVESLYVEAVKH